ncbi:agmatine deiminase family protein [Thermodesulfobium sp. 4217-1]|uniref:agmatine deiminase family protein n=1 Tax=Thermodesulfobium sp. 4217-1 TaxID=3120013 RepID=UPI003221ED62
MNNLISEWEQQDALMLVYPHEKSDWNDNLLKVRTLYHELIKKAIKFGKIILIIPENMNYKNELNIDDKNLICIKAKTNDTWIRDNGPIFIKENGIFTALNFKFNGWGNKFNYKLDNDLNNRIFSSNLLAKSVMKKNLNFVLEGGSIDNNGDGIILTTENCLLNKNRNPQYSKDAIEGLFYEVFGQNKILWLKNGKLMGDHTDSHIDMLAKFVNKDTIVYVKSANRNYPYFNELKLMEEELKDFRDCNDKPFNLVPIILPEIKDGQGNYLPATYTNFLIFNSAVVVPIYNSKEDIQAMSVFESIFLNKEIIQIDCRILISQGGAIHCTTNNIPKGFLNQEVLIDEH